MNDLVNAIRQAFDITNKKGVHQKPRFSTLGEHLFGERFGERLVNAQMTKRRNINWLHGAFGERFSEHLVNDTPIVHQPPPLGGGER